MPAEIGEVELTAVDVSPTEVSPGGVTRVSVKLNETAEVVGGPFGDLRLCVPEGWNTTGLEVEVHIEPEWGTAREDVVCVPVSNITSGELDVVYEFTAPDIPEGVEKENFSVSVWFESTKNDKKSGIVTQQVVVSRGSAAKDEPDDSSENDNSGGFNIAGYALENPGKAVLGAGAVYFVLTTATETATEEVI